MEKKIVGLNTYFKSLEYENFDEYEFSARISLLDYDAVVINAEYLITCYSTSYDSSYQNKPCLSDYNSAQIVEDFKKIEGQIKELLKQGRNVFVLMGNNDNCYIYTGEKQYSGTGRNARQTNIVREFNAYSFLPIKLNVTEVVGERIDICCSSPYRDFFTNTRTCYYYASYFSVAENSTILGKIKGTDKVVAAVIPYGSGKIVLLPQIYEEEEYKTEDVWKENGKIEERGDGMTIEEMKKRKRELGYTYEQISKMSNVPLGTVQKIFAGVTESPRYDTIAALSQIFQNDTVSCVQEAQSIYNVKRQGAYTLEDYYALPEEQRVELIDGVIYDMSAPTSVHQLLGTEILLVLKDYIRKQHGRCVPIASPIDVQLDCDDKTMVQPDVIVVCDREKIQNRCIYGAPDFVAEVLSESTRKKDLVLKLNKYMTAGVREYWLVDPDRKKVIVYDFEKEDYPMMYGFEARIPVGIFDGECEVDFQEIYAYVKDIVGDWN